ncbi:hypothetical protein WDZ92_48135, partial [Nostoc sp. NIES-2111]
YDGWGGKHIVGSDGNQPDLYRIDCPTCENGYEIPSANLVVACLDALDRKRPNERIVRLPEDVDGHVDQSAASVSQWRFVERQNL